MNVLSWNIRGLGSDGKSTWCRKLKVENEIGFIMLQETQFESLEKIDVSRFWGPGEYEFDHVDATGRSGGLISFWNPKLFKKTSVFKVRNVLAISGLLRSDGRKMTVVNVYCPQRITEKRVVWDFLKTFMAGDDGLWIVGGDFNSVRDREERRNSNFNVGESIEFNEFVEDAGLFEYGLKGRKYTYLVGNKLSRIDRIFVDWVFLNEWPNAEYRVLDRDGSDHCPLLLKVESRNFGAKPFKFFNSWLQKEGFDDVVKSAVSTVDFNGDPDFRLMLKFKVLRAKITEWKVDLLVAESEELNCLSTEVKDLELLLETRDLTEEELWILEEAKKRIKQLEYFRVKDLKQKSRVIWAKEGDENSRFFHGSINTRRVSNAIMGLSVNGVWVTKPKEVKREVLRFFSNKFVEEMYSRPKLNCYGLKTISDEQADLISGPFVEKEIKEAVWQCGSDKAPV